MEFLIENLKLIWNPHPCGEMLRVSVKQDALFIRLQSMHTALSNEWSFFEGSGDLLCLVLLHANKLRFASCNNALARIFLMRTTWRLATNCFSDIYQNIQQLSRCMYEQF